MSGFPYDPLFTNEPSLREGVGLEKGQELVGDFLPATLTRMDAVGGGIFIVIGGTGFYLLRRIMTDTSPGEIAQTT